MTTIIGGNVPLAMPVSSAKPISGPIACVVVAADGRGAVRSVGALRWGNVGQDAFGYIPFGGHVHAERTFGGLTVPSRLSVGWWFGTPRYEPFFEAEITDLAQVGAG